jgi:amidophosphoribosyltransferase
MNGLDAGERIMEEERDQDRPHEECGVFAVYGQRSASRVAFFGLFAIQHRGQESAGIAVADGCQVLAHKGMGLASEVFREEILGKLPVAWRSATSVLHDRLVVLSNAQPFLVHHADEYYALAHNGNLNQRPGAAGGT